MAHEVARNERYYGFAKIILIESRGGLHRQALIAGSQEGNDKIGRPPPYKFHRI